MAAAALWRASIGFPSGKSADSFALVSLRAGAVPAQQVVIMQVSATLVKGSPSAVWSQQSKEPRPWPGGAAGSRVSSGPRETEEG